LGLWFVCNLGFVICNFPDKPVLFGSGLSGLRTDEKNILGLILNIFPVWYLEEGMFILTTTG
jgi:hypothetical protein